MLQGYKTVIFNVIMGVIMLIKALAPDAEVPGESGVLALIDQADVFLTSLWAVGNIVLRAVTSSPIFAKKESGL